MGELKFIRKLEKDWFLILTSQGLISFKSFSYYTQLEVSAKLWLTCLDINTSAAIQQALFPFPIILSLQKSFKLRKGDTEKKPAKATLLNSGGTLSYAVGHDTSQIHNFYLLLLCSIIMSTKTKQQSSDSIYHHSWRQVWNRKSPLLTLCCFVCIYFLTESVIECWGAFIAMMAI